MLDASPSPEFGGWEPLAEAVGWWGVEGAADEEPWGRRCHSSSVTKGMKGWSSLQCNCASFSPFVLTAATY